MRNAVISLALVLLFAPAALADMTGPATVIEGDLIEIMGERIRLYGIDAPERGQRCTYLGKTFDCGHIAKTALMDLTAGATGVCPVCREQSIKVIYEYVNPVDTSAPPTNLEVTAIDGE